MRKFYRSTCVLMILTVLLAIIPAFAAPTKSFPANSMWVEPDVTLNTETTHVNDNFTVTIYANVTSVPGDSGHGVGAWQFKIWYNNTQLKAWKCVYKVGTTPGQSEFFQDIPVATVSPSFGTFGGLSYVLFGESWHGDPTSGPFATVPAACRTGGGLAVITFQVLAVPPKGIGNKLTSSLDISTEHPSNTKITGYDVIADVLDTCHNANYEYDWVTPSSPYFAISPLGTSYGPFANVTGTTFTETITLKSLDAAWYIMNASCTLNYSCITHPGIVVVSNVAFGPAWNGSACSFDNTTAPLQALGLAVWAPDGSDLHGDLKIADVTFTILYQGLAPLSNTVPLFFDNSTPDLTEAWSDPFVIPLGQPVTGSITILGLVAAPIPWLQLAPASQTFGPVPVVGTTFDIQVWIVNLTSYWRLIGLQYRISYNDTYFAVDHVTEGPYIPSFNQTNVPPPATWFTSYDEPDTFGPHVLVGELLLPNGTGQWPGPFPGATAPAVTNGLIATITFRIISQAVAWPLTSVTLPFNFIQTSLIDDEGNPLLQHDPRNATVTIFAGVEIGCVLDEYGGASNSGQWAGYPNAFPAPYGGQGANMPMDVVEPQSEVTFYADVTYNFWPVQSKDVGFELEGPFVKNESDPTQLIPKQTYQIWFKLTARTDENGVARITVRMPWPCVDPESITGIYLETSTCQLADVTLSDKLSFYYEHMVYITKVTVTPFYVYHDESVHVTVNYETHAMQDYPVLFSVVIQDELGVPFGNALFSTTMGGAQFCTWTTGEFCVDIYVPKWAFTGYAYVHVSAYNKDPTIGGFSYGQEYTPPPMIFILPAYPPTVSITPAKVTWDMTSGPITFTAVPSGGVLPYTYQWYTDGYEQPGATGINFTINSWSEGTHTVSVEATDHYGRTATGYATLTTVPLAVYITPTPVTWNINATSESYQANVTFTAVPSGGVLPYTYQWYIDGVLQSATTVNFTITTAPTLWVAHMVTIVVTDGQGFTATATAVLFVVYED